MSAESNAWHHVTAFRWWAGAPDITDDEACRRDLLAVRDAADEALAALVDEADGDAS